MLILRRNYWIHSQVRAVSTKSLLLALFMIVSFSMRCFSASYYVDNSVASSGNGSSWGSAWRSFSSINWGIVNAGDTIYISGGSTSKTYNETLTVGKSGLSGNSITIARGVDAGHNGTPILPKLAISDRNYVAVKRLNIRNGSSDEAVYISGSSAGVLVEDNDVYSGNGRGFNVRSTTGTLTIRNNRVTTPGNTIAQTDGIYLQDNTGVVIFEDNNVEVSNIDSTGHSDALQTHRNGSMIIRNNVSRVQPQEGTITYCGPMQSSTDIR
jgi:hypothetical protein